MGHEINIDHILDLEKQIEEGAGDIIKLKRARNSLLNISTIVPPEILGSIFRWNVIPDGGLPPFDAYPEGTYNFLLVCHRWFEVASHTPELWGFWGNTLKKWSRWYKRSGTTPVDLVLGRRGDTRGSDISLDGPLRDALRERTACDAIRSLHLWSARSRVTSILSTLTPVDDEDVRCSSIESISLQYVNASRFFTRYRFPKLWYLDFSTGVKISSWEDFGLRTTALTTLSLVLNNASPVPTTPQLLSILTFNPRLQSLTLSGHMIPCDNGDGSTVPVPLRYLKNLTLSGDFHPLFRLLRRLDHPKTMDGIMLTMLHCTVEDILGTLGPYMQDYIQRDGRFRDELGIHHTSCFTSISTDVSIISSVTGPIQKVTFATFIAILQNELSPAAESKLCIDFVAHIPGEHVVYFCGGVRADAVGRIVAGMPKIRELHLTGALSVYGLLHPGLGGPLANNRLLPSLQRLRLENIMLNEDAWSPIIPYLAYQTSGGQRISLTISGRSQHICKGVLRKITDLVEELVLELTLDEDCPFTFGGCSASERKNDGGAIWR